MEFKSPYTETSRKCNTWCNYTKRIDTYGCGCQHDCSYCYAKGLLYFRGFWDNKNPRISNLTDIKKAIKNTPRYSVIKLGGMTDCFQPLEKEKRVTYETIKLLNYYRINYLIVTKNSLVAAPEYLQIYDKDLAHFQISITSTNQQQFEKASHPKDRINAIETLYNYGFDVTLRLSPFMVEYVDLNIINNVKCDKILIEFLKVNHNIKKYFDIDYSKYTFNYGGHLNLQLDEKINQVKKITGFSEISVGEYVHEHHQYFSNAVNYNKNDCCNLTLKDLPYKKPIQLIIPFI
jgi:DNA repair photolyase